MKARLIARALPLVLMLMEPAVRAADAPEGSQSAVVAPLFDARGGTICGIKLGDPGADVLNKLSFPDEEQREGAQIEFKRCMGIQKYFLTPLPGVSNVKLGFSRFGGEFIEVQCTSKDLKSVEGVGVGCTLGEFAAAFGNPIKTYPVGGGILIGHIYQSGVMKIFAFSSGDALNSVVTRIVLQRSGN